MSGISGRAATTCAAPSCREVGGQCAELERLLHVVQELSMAKSLDAIQDLVRHAARELTGADGATFVLRDGDQCFYADEDAIAPLWKGRRFPLSACISGWSMLHRKPVVIEDIYQDARIPADAYRPTFVKSLAMVPIRSSDPVGAIGNYWARRHRADAKEIGLLQALADSTSIAIENAALLDALWAAKEAAEVANRLKDEFLSTVSHELRTPLTPILAWAEVMVAGMATGDELHEAAEAIRSNAALQLRHVDALLDVSQIIGGSLRLDLAPVRVEPIVAAAVEAMRPAAMAKRIAIERLPGPDAGEVIADARRVQQIAWSLLSNAVKFTPPGGRVSVSLARSATHVELAVADTGEGLTTEFVPHLFERFRQHDGSMTRAAGGLGLGLATVRHLVELHGGTVTAASPGKGQGSTFTVRLPLRAGSCA